MMKYLVSVIAITLGLFTSPLLVANARAADAQATNAQIRGITITAAWARASTGGRRPSAAYLTLRNAGQADVLTGIASPVAEKVRIHQSVMENGVMRMRSAEPLSLPSGAEIQMKPGGFHIMLMRLKQPVEKDGVITLTLTFEKAGDVTIEVPVKHAGATHGRGHGAGMKSKTH